MLLQAVRGTWLQITHISTLKFLRRHLLWNRLLVEAWPHGMHASLHGILRHHARIIGEILIRHAHVLEILVHVRLLYQVRIVVRAHVSPRVG